MTHPRLFLLMVLAVMMVSPCDAAAQGWKDALTASLEVAVKITRATSAQVRVEGLEQSWSPSMKGLRR